MSSHRPDLQNIEDLYDNHPNDELPEDPVPCKGCGEAPVNIGTFGRYKLACSYYVSRDRDRTTDECVGNLGGRSYHSYIEARIDWDEKNR